MIKAIKMFLLASMCLSTATAQEAMPFTVNVGCFTNNFDSCGNCTGVDLSCSFNEVTDTVNFGYTVARLCKGFGNAIIYGDNQEKRADANATIANNNLAAFNNCSASLSTANANSSNAFAALNKQKQLVLKLRKACGSKCKKIK